MLKTIKIPIYFVPGLAASVTIFEFLQLPEDKFEIILLDWLIPQTKNESLASYVKRMSERIKHKDFILVGVSFGGIIVQEMNKYCTPKKTIIISSVKHENEFPLRLKTIKNTKAYKLTPIKILANIEQFAKYSFGETIKKRVALYQKYLAMRNKTYLAWSIQNVLNWTKSVEVSNLHHIHGNNDKIFPIKNIKNCIIVNGGTHIMILNKAKKITKIIETICLNKTQQ